MRKIIHIDMDAFYASVEQRDRPDLKGVPLAVGHGEKRGVVAAASYEARKFGVRSAMPSVTAKRLCPDLVFVPPRFEVYRVVSQQIQRIFRDYTDLVEPLSLDEAYLDVTHNLRGIETACATAKEIRSRVWQETALTASAGVSYNKFLAKLASDYRKPNGQFVILPDQGAPFVASLPVGKFHGIGPKTADKMNTLGIFLGSDLRCQSLAFLQDHFGKVGNWYFTVARGEDNRLVQPNRTRKSSGSETTFSQDLSDRKSIEHGIATMADDVWEWCAMHQQFGRTVTIKIKFSDFRQITRSQSMTRPLDSQHELRRQSIGLMQAVYPLPLTVRLVGVAVSNFLKKSDPNFSPQFDFALDA